ncbi:MAG TPA: polyphenol oxidase family protein [Thermoanaerobaculia bacterium]|nr:polyphenol oxidase family protein [Thermoanaerobaculia bacterium]
MPGFSIEASPIGRIVVAPEVPPGHRLFYTTIDSRGAIDAELEAFAGMPVAHCNQVHGATVLGGGQALLPVRPHDAGRQARVPVLHGECDALWSSEPAALAIKTADCLPVSMIGSGTIANIHCGWRGAVQRIVDATLDVVGIPDAAWLGPSIRVCCFEVGEEVAQQFPAEFVDRSRAKPHVDIPAFIASRLRARGVPRTHDSELCTRCDGSIFHSFRRDGRSGGRNLAILVKQ